MEGRRGKAGSLHLMATSGPKRQPPADPGSRAELGEAVRRDSSHRREKVTSAVAPGTSSYSSKQSKQHCHTLDPEVPCQVPYRGISRPGSSRGDSSALCLPTSRTQKLPARSPQGHLKVWELTWWQLGALPVQLQTAGRCCAPSTICNINFNLKQQCYTVQLLLPTYSVS